jgi:hypothetical protein
MYLNAWSLHLPLPALQDYEYNDAANGGEEEEEEGQEEGDEFADAHSRGEMHACS